MFRKTQFRTIYIISPSHIKMNFWNGQKPTLLTITCNNYDFKRKFMD